MIFKKFRDRKLKANDKVLSRINGKQIRYVSRRGDDNVEEILGKGGCITVTKDEVIVDCQGEIVFTCPKKTVEISELISLGGARIIDHSVEEHRAVSVFFTTFNK